jgi:hypothetical protein
MATPKTIVLRGRGIRKEAIADAGSAIKPGYLLERDNATEVSEHSSAGENAVPMFAVENEVVGKDIDTVYAVGDNVLFEVMTPGTEVYALVAASATAITAGAFVESAGDGTVRIASTSAATADTERLGIIGQALEDVDNSGGGSEARIRIEIR